MLKTITILAAVVAVAMSAPNAPDQDTANNSRPNIDFVSYGGCASKPNGNYLHPWDCTRFITCSNGLASDMACGDCDPNNVAQCQGNQYLVYKLQGDYCEWPALATCNAVATTENPNVSTDAPITEPTDAPITEPTDAPVVPGTGCKDTVAGSECDIDCDQCNWCELDALTGKPVSHFYWCNPQPQPNPFLPQKGAWVKGTCSEGHLVDTTKKLSAAGGISGGQCTPWNFIDAAVQDAYKADVNCVKPRDPHCFYQEDDTCSSNYYYIHTDGSQTKQSCPAGTVWVQATENCLEGTASGTGC